MDIFTLIIWIITFSFLVFSFFKDRQKTKKALQMAFRMGRRMALSIFTIVITIGLLLTLLPPERIASFVSGQHVITATLGAALIGTVTLVPAFIAFPLIGTLVGAGVHIVPSVAFLTTLTMVGVVTLPLERKEFGTKFTVVRNTASFIAAILIALLMGVLV